MLKILWWLSIALRKKSNPIAFVKKTLHGLVFAHLSHFIFCHCPPSSHSWSHPDSLIFLRHARIFPYVLCLELPSSGFCKTSSLRVYRPHLKCHFRKTFLTVSVILYRMFISIITFITICNYFDIKILFTCLLSVSSQ